MEKKLDSERLKYFMKLRNIKIGELSKQTGLSLRIIYEYREDITKPRAKNLGKLVTALKVREIDLLKDKEALAVEKKIDELKTLIKECKPHYIEKNFTFLKKLLEWTDETSLKIFDFLMEKSSNLGKTELWFRLKIMHSLMETNTACLELNRISCTREPMAGSELDSNRLKYYMKWRDIRIGELSQGTEINRNSLCDYCNGRTKPRVPNLYKIVNALEVRALDLLEQEEIPDVKEKAGELNRLLEQCQTYYIEKNYAYLKKLLDWTDETSLEIFEFLMGESENIEKTKLWYIQESLCRLPEMNKDYISPIQIFYTKDSYDDNNYECQVKFEPWVYTIFGMEDKADEFIPIEIRGEEDSPEWHEDMREQLEQIIFEEWANQIEEYWLPSLEELLMPQKNWQVPQCLDSTQISSSQSYSELVKLCWDMIPDSEKK